MRKWTVLLLVALLALPSFALAAPTLEELEDEIASLSDRLDRAELHAATDRITFTVV